MSGDRDLLSPELAARSLSSERAIVPAADAARALDELRAAGRRLVAWEGWVLLPGGARTRSLEHAGAFVLPADAERAAAVVVEQVERAMARWARKPEYPGAALYVELETTG